MSAEAATEDLGGLVREHPDLTPAEKETTVRFAKDQDRATVFTAEAGVGRRLLAHPRADVQDVNVLEDGGTRPVAPSEVSGRDIVGVRVSIPVGALKVALSARSASGHAEVVSERVYSDGASE
ncbi:hypothetical protein [Halobellus ruber]|uniref:Uncharacterized protein n=1 Tax=Halobellus ruber TaxID=2761102 RepID=A0A7J9SNY5_9EURY|nr:hypothetical protein [Halobellus ruber]MBB6647976.1 hypothetical protein [Halobellus ruber]